MDNFFNLIEILTKAKNLPEFADKIKEFVLNNAIPELDELKEINTIITEISKLNNLTTKQMNDLSSHSFETAGKYGRKAADYLTEVKEMAGAGYKNPDQLAELSLMAQNTKGFDADLAKDYITASDAAYQYSGNVEKLTSLLDAQKKVTDQNAVSMDELLNATKASAGNLKNFGIREDEMTALFGTGIASTQESGETVGRALNGIIMSLQKTKGETGFGSEFLDERALTKVEERCRNVGVELTYVKDGMVNLRNPMEILKELAQVYNSLPDGSSKKAGILSDIGGNYRSDVLSGILSNWDLYEKMIGDYENAEGTAMNEAMKSADSWEGSLTKLSNTWTDTVGNIANSDAVLTIINSFQGLLSVLNTATDALGSFGSIGVGAGLISGLKNVGSPKMFGLNSDLNMPTAIQVLMDT